MPDNSSPLSSLLPLPFPGSRTGTCSSGHGCRVGISPPLLFGSPYLGLEAHVLAPTNRYGKVIVVSSGTTHIRSQAGSLVLFICGTEGRGYYAPEHSVVHMGVNTHSNGYARTTDVSSCPSTACPHMRIGVECCLYHSPHRC